MSRVLHLLLGTELLEGESDGVYGAQQIKKTLLVINGLPTGPTRRATPSTSPWAVSKRDDTQVKVFLMGDAVT